MDPYGLFHVFSRKAYLLGVWLTVSLVVVQPSILRADEPPFLLIQGPESLASLKTRLNAINPQGFRSTMNFLGLHRPTAPIQVILAPEESEWARHVPSWVAGYALSQKGIVVILADRVPSYPYESLESVLLHEVAHVLASRAAGDHRLPRWFDEGLAMISARTWDLEDRARLIWAMVSGQKISLEELNGLFLKDEASARQAYVLAHAFTLDLLQRTSPDFPREILARLSQGQSFNEAFAATALMTPKRAEDLFWADQSVWTRWMPVATSTGMLWLMVAFLLFLVYRQQRKRTAAIRKQWSEEDDPDF